MKLKKYLAAGLVACSANAMAQEINLSGFASAHATQLLGGSSAPEYYSKTTDYFSFSKFGLNISSNLNSKFSIQSQVLMSGRRTLAGSDQPQWDMHANWLFLAYRPNENLRFRIGRQLFPAWMVSEYIDVGYMYPWTETPHSVYELAPFKSLNGIAADYSFQLNDTQKLTVTFFGGQESVKIPIAQGGNDSNEYGSMVGSEVALTGNGHKLRAMGSYYNVASTTTDTAGNVTSTNKNNDVKTLTTGYRYDANKIMVYAEYGIREGGSGTKINQVTFDKYARVGYITAGYWMGSVLPHVTASQTYWNTGSVKGTQDLYSLGVNVKLDEGIMFKSNIGYSISSQGPSHMTKQGDATTAVTGFDVIF